MQSFDQHLLQLLQQGAIAKEMALSSATNPADLDVQIRVGVPSEDMAIERHDYGSMSDEDFAKLRAQG
jgi:Tfp pilus assembly ATPase PilU